MNKKRVMVTGGSGFIGSHTVVELLDKGYDVTIVDNLYNSDISVVENLKTLTGKEFDFKQVDCCDMAKMREIFEEKPFHAAIHFAAYKAVGESVYMPLEYYSNNITSALNLLSLMKEFSVNAFVFSSSCTVYGQPDVLPATENTPKKPALSPYGKTKQVCENIMEDLSKTDTTIKSIALRYFNPIGAHPSLLIGEKPNGVPNNLLPYLTQTAFGIRDYLGVFGSDYNTPDGTAIRDYIDVTDLAKAHVAAVARLIDCEEAEKLEYYNVGTGNGVSVLEIIHAFEEANDMKLNYRLMPRREGDIEAVWAETSLIEEKLGWKAVVPLTETLRNSWLWEQKMNGKI